MSPGHFTTMATLICGPAGLLVRYEWSGDCFRWNFYRGARRVKSIKKATAVIQAAEKLVDAR
jgi:hypothetical protein